MTGRLVGSVDGRPVEVLGEGDSLRVALSGVLDAWRLRGRSVGASSALQAVSQFGLGLKVSVGSTAFEVLPQPHPLVRWFGPRLSDA
ncbi:MAG: hypothetical protein AAF907_11270 [Planctomycetota bacterium]